MRTIILSLGMLHNVNLSLFIARMLFLASKNKNFVNTKENLAKILPKCAEYAASFNRGECTPDDFKRNILAELGNLEMSDEEFWEEWNKIVTIDAAKTHAILEQLKAFCDFYNVRIIFTSDTNQKHFEKIQEIYRANGHVIAGITNKLLQVFQQNSLMLDDIFPVYPTYLLHCDRNTLNQIMVDRSRNFILPSDQVDLVMGDPNNHSEEVAKIKAQKEVAEMEKWCQQNEVTVVLHKKSASLIDTLMAAIMPKNQMTQQISARF